jgi:hypothetical protein
MEELEAAIVEMQESVAAMAEGPAPEAQPASAEPATAAPEPAPEPEPPAAPEPDAPEPGTTAPEGARLVALNMALSGKPREETASYLRENFDLDDADALLDDVYARAGS